MGILEILLIIACTAIVFGVIITSIINKKRGKSSCDCGCSACSKCSGCFNKAAKTEKQKKD